MKTIAVDWDGTLVDSTTQDWLPGAQLALRRLLRDYDLVVIWTSRAAWKEGRSAVERALKTTRVPHPGCRGVLRVEPKPHADAYIDDKAIRFTGSWKETLAHLEHGTSPRPDRRGITSRRKAS